MRQNKQSAITQTPSSEIRSVRVAWENLLCFYGRNNITQPGTEPKGNLVTRNIDDNVLRTALRKYFSPAEPETPIPGALLFPERGIEHALDCHRARAPAPTNLLPGWRIATLSRSCSAVASDPLFRWHSSRPR